MGGAEVHLLSQARGQTERGHVVRVLYLKGAGSLASEMRAAGAELVGRAGPSALLRGIRWADLVHSHLLKADLACAAAAALLGRRRVLVSSKHNDEQVLLRPIVSRVHGVAGNVPARTIVLSDHVGRFFERHGRLEPARIRRVYYGIDPAAFEAAARGSPERCAALRASFGFAPEDVVFVCVARFAPQKAHGVLLRALARAGEPGPGGTGVRAPAIRLLLVGDDPFGDGRKEAERLARELRLEGRAVFAGIRRDVPDLLAMSDAFVMASLWEGLGLVFLEAMATGLPVVATRVSAVPEVVVDGETGVLVPPSDPEALSRAMTYLAADPGLRERMGRAGAARVRERFGLERMVEETLAVYAEVLGQAGSVQPPQPPRPQGGGVKSPSQGDR